MQTLKSVFFLLILSFYLTANDQILNIGNGSEPKDLDPHTTVGVPEYRIQLNLFEPLVDKNPKTLKPIPGVAESWTLSKDAKKYTFKLRKNALWSNGDKVTAHDFIYAWTRLLKPETASEYAYQAHYILNGKEFNEGKIKDPKQLGIKAIDDYTLEIQLVSPTPSFFLGLLNHHSLFPVHQKTIEKFGAKWTRPENMVSNGAFKLAQWEMNKVVSIVPNPNYWDGKKTKLQRANFLPTENTNTEEKMFRAKEVDITYEIPQEKIDFWKKDKSGVYQNSAFLGTYFYMFNVTRKPLQDKRVRKALALAIDREKVVKFVTKGDQIPGTMYVPPGTGEYKPVEVMPKDLSKIEEAKRLLSEAGFPNGKGFPKIDILYNNHEGHKKVAEALQEMWKKNLNIDIGLYNQEWKVFLDTQKNLNYHIARKGWVADYNDPNTFLDLFTTYSGNNNTGWSFPEYDQLIAKASKEMNVKKRMAIFQTAEKLLLEELPIIPIYIYTRNYLMSTKVVGYEPNIEDFHPLKYVSVVAK